MHELVNPFARKLHKKLLPLVPLPICLRIGPRHLAQENKSSRISPTFLHGKGSSIYPSSWTFTPDLFSDGTSRILWLVKALLERSSVPSTPEGYILMLIFHSDRGSQYTSKALGRAMAVPKWQPSMSAKGYCYDNAFAESCFASLKNECLPDDGLFDSHEQAQQALFDYLESFYNRTRKHSSLGMIAPQEFLELYFSKQNFTLN